MNLRDLRRLMEERLDEDATEATTGHYTPADMTRALNAAQLWFVALTLCLEKSGTLPLSANVTWYHARSTFADWLAPLRISVVGGARLAYNRLADLDALNVAWQATAGTPERYAALGSDLLAFTKQPSAGGTNLSVVYAYFPARMTADADVPAIPKEYHPTLVDFGIPRLRVREGGQDFATSLFYLGRFLEDVQKCATYVRQRALAQRYDVLPPELKRADLSRMIRVRPVVEPKRTKGLWLPSATPQEPAPSSSQT